MTEVLAPSAWMARREAHVARVRAWTDPHQERAGRGERHPVLDFLFTYYAFRPAWLRRWHPGPGTILAGSEARKFLRWPAYRETDDGVSLDPTLLSPGRRNFIVWLRDLLQSMQGRPAFFGCHGLHEWAMVYRQTPDAIRHDSWPLRLSPDAIAAAVEAAPLRCTHFDAFRFFTPQASPLNRTPLSRESVPANEQRGCLHANMDLYKWSFKLAPAAPSGLIADCFELARDLRELDMRASPYDLRALGYEPIPIETAAGRLAYESAQRAGAARADALRTRLLALCNDLLASPSHEQGARGPLAVGSPPRP